MKDAVFIPEYDDRYVPWGNFEHVLKVIKSGEFYPVWITGHSGNGKSSMIEQACALANLPADYITMNQKKKLKVLEEYQEADKPLGREYIRINFTAETDESDLLGGRELLNGNSVFKKGPVVEAMERGAILLLDECLEENEEVRIGTVDNWKPVKLKDLSINTTYDIPSFNMDTGEYENDTGRIISMKEDNVYDVVLEDGRSVCVTGNHPFIVKTVDGQYIEKTIDRGLSLDDDIVTIL